jgi:hypothetical protein
MGEKAVISAIKNLEEAIGQLDRASTRPQLEQTETQRGEILQRFPRDHRPEMTLEEYALGQQDSEDTFCRPSIWSTPQTYRPPGCFFLISLCLAFDI